MGLHVILYGPVRGTESLLDALLEIHQSVTEVIIVRYAGTSERTPRSSPVPSRTVFVKDPGTFRVEEHMANGRVAALGSSNSRRQFMMIRAGLGQLAGAPDSDLVFVVRSDLAVSSRGLLKQFLIRTERVLRADVTRFVRLTVNSVNPLSFTGHKLHGSDWLFATRLANARQLFSFDPALFAVGTYTGMQWIRKGDFCFGAFSAEQLFCMAAYTRVGQVASSGNAIALPWSASFQFLRENYFVLPSEAGLSLAKWEYLYDPSLTLDHPFGRGPIGTLRRICAWLLFWSELTPASGRWFSLKLVLKALFSWIIHTPIALLRAERLLCEGKK